MLKLGYLLAALAYTQLPEPAPPPVAGLDFFPRLVKESVLVGEPVIVELQYKDQVGRSWWVPIQLEKQCLRPTVSGPVPEQPPLREPNVWRSGSLAPAARGDARLNLADAFYFDEPGEYEIVLAGRVHSHGLGWRSVSADALTLKVVEPTGEEGQAFALLKTKERGARLTSEVFALEGAQPGAQSVHWPQQRVAHLVAKYPKSVYAPYCRLAQISWLETEIGDRSTWEEWETACRRLIADHAETYIADQVTVGYATELVRNWEEHPQGQQRWRPKALAALNLLEKDPENLVLMSRAYELRQVIARVQAEAAKGKAAPGGGR